MVCLSVCWLSIPNRRKSPPEPVAAVSCEDERASPVHGSPFSPLWPVLPSSDEEGEDFHALGRVCAEAVA